MLTKTQNTPLEKEMGAIEIQSEGVALAHLAHTESKLTLLNCDFFPHNSPNELGTTLKNIISKYNLKDVKLNWVLHPKHYRLLLIDLPAEVPPSEYKEAAKWQIKDIIDYPLEDLAIEVFEPGDTQKKGAQKLYVVAAQLSFLQETIDIFRENLLNVVAIDIKEFALRNLAKLAHKSTNHDEIIAHLHMNVDDCLLIITQKNTLNFSRRIPVGLNTIKNLVNLNGLVNEIQRSLSYYYTTFKRDKPSFSLIYPSIEISDTNKPIVDYIAEGLNVKAQLASLKTLINTAPNLNSKLEQQCYIAIGGALRNIEAD